MKIQCIIKLVETTEDRTFDNIIGRGGFKNKIFLSYLKIKSGQWLVKAGPSPLNQTLIFTILFQKLINHISFNDQCLLWTRMICIDVYLFSEQCPILFKISDWFIELKVLVTLTFSYPKTSFNSIFSI